MTRNLEDLEAVLEPDRHHFRQIDRASVANDVGARKLSRSAVVESISITEILNVPPDGRAHCEVANQANDGSTNRPASDPAPRDVFGRDGDVGRPAANDFDSLGKFLGAMREIPIHLHKNIEIPVLKSPLSAGQQGCASLT